MRTIHAKCIKDNQALISELYELQGNAIDHSMDIGSINDLCFFWLYNGDKIKQAIIKDYYTLLSKKDLFYDDRYDHISLINIYDNFINKYWLYQRNLISDKQFKYYRSKLAYWID